MSDVLSVALSRLSRVDGVRGALIVDAQAGVPVVSELADGVAEPAVAALAASLFRRTAKAAGAAAFGGLETLQLEAEAGHVVMAGAGELVVVVVAEADAQLGLIRLEAQRAAGSLA
ncbi:MAG: roadblock/LC7 domain-containing protein [Gemmatimonadetes bacterium]|nr:roadblock/LC7 domain-containing protein [Gemmatimonadota bacterium]